MGPNFHQLSDGKLLGLTIRNLIKISQKIQQRKSIRKPPCISMSKDLSTSKRIQHLKKLLMTDYVIYNSHEQANSPSNNSL